MPKHGVLLVLLFLLTGCDQALTVPQQVIAVIRDMQSRVEAGERRPFMQHVAADFSGQGGQMNRDQLNALVLYNLRRYDRLQAQLMPIQVVETGPDRAQASFRALLTGGPGWLPENGQVFNIETRWVRQDTEWLLLSADWNPVRLEDVLGQSN